MPITPTKNSTRLHENSPLRHYPWPEKQAEYLWISLIGWRIFSLNNDFDHLTITAFLMRTLPTLCGVSRVGHTTLSHENLLADATKKNIKIIRASLDIIPIFLATNPVGVIIRLSQVLIRSQSHFITYDRRFQSLEGLWKQLNETHTDWEGGTVALGNCFLLGSKFVQAQWGCNWWRARSIKIASK